MSEIDRGQALIDESMVSGFELKLKEYKMLKFSAKNNCSAIFGSSKTTIFLVGNILGFPEHRVSLCVPHNIQIESPQLTTVEVHLELRAGYKLTIEGNTLEMPKKKTTSLALKSFN